MSPRPPQGSHADNHNAYIPSSVQQAMSRQMQQASMPAHLRQYVGSDKPTYISARTQAELTNFMQKSMPAHLQEYAGAYVQQNIVDPTLRGSHGVRNAVAPPPTARRGQQSRSAFVPGEQPHAQYLNLFQPDAVPGKAAQPMVATPGTELPQPTATAEQPPVINVPGQDPYVAPPPQPANPQAPVEHSPYDFIINPQEPSKAPSPLAGNSMFQRILIVVGGFVLLIIAATVVMSLINSSGFNTAPFLSVAQQQTELIRVASAGATTAGGETTQALAYNVQLSITTANQQLNTYVANNHKRLNPKLLGAAHSSTVDTELQNAQANNTYDQTLTSVLQDDLNSYATALKTAYTNTTDPVGRKLLSDEYNGAQLLIQQAQANQPSAANP